MIGSVALAVVGLALGSDAEGAGTTPEPYVTVYSWADGTQIVRITAVDDAFYEEKLQVFTGMSVELIRMVLGFPYETVFLYFDSDSNPRFLLFGSVRYGVNSTELGVRDIFDVIRFFSVDQQMPSGLERARIYEFLGWIDQGIEKVSLDVLALYLLGVAAVSLHFPKRDEEIRKQSRLKRRVVALLAQEQSSFSNETDVRMALRDLLETAGILTAKTMSDKYVSRVCERGFYRFDCHDNFLIGSEEGVAVVEYDKRMYMGDGAGYVSDHFRITTAWENDGLLWKVTHHQNEGPGVLLSTSTKGPYDALFQTDRFFCAGVPSNLSYPELVKARRSAKMDVLSSLASSDGVPLKGCMIPQMIQNPNPALALLPKFLQQYGTRAAGT
jgi:hypothetical protein